MSDMKEPARRSGDARQTLLIGGVLLLASVLIGVVTQQVVFAVPGVTILGALVFAGALVVFALGIRGQGSVVGRRRSGVSALVAVALWSVMARVVYFVIGQQQTSGAGITVFVYVDMAVRFSLMAVAVAQVARARVLPYPWNLAPMWAFVAITVPEVLIAILGVSIVAGAAGQSAYLAAAALSSFAHLAAPTFLGVLAIVLATRPPRIQTIPIYSSQRGEQ